MKHTLRVVAFDPTTRGFAYAIMEGRWNLIDWGMVHVLLRTDSNILSRVKKIIDRTLPDLVVVEDGRGTRRRERARRINKRIAELAKRHNIPVRRVSRSCVREALKPAFTKDEIALAVASIFPELGPRLPRPRDKSYKTEDERMSIFDAVSFALAALS
jgi:hypothetical protein